MFSRTMKTLIRINRDEGHRNQECDTLTSSCSTRVSASELVLLPLEVRRFDSCFCGGSNTSEPTAVTEAGLRDDEQI